MWAAKSITIAARHQPLIFWLFFPLTRPGSTPLSLANSWLRCRETEPWVDHGTFQRNNPTSSDHSFSKLYAGPGPKTQDPGRAGLYLARDHCTYCTRLMGCNAARTLQVEAARAGLIAGNCSLPRTSVLFFISKWSQFCSVLILFLLVQHVLRSFNFQCITDETWSWIAHRDRDKGRGDGKQARKKR